MNKRGERTLALVRGAGVPDERKQPFDGDLETARRRIRSLAGVACKVLDARMLNVASFHLDVYMDAVMQQAHLVDSRMSKTEAERVREWWRKFKEIEWEKGGLREEGAIALVFLEEVPHPDRTVRKSRGRDGKRQPHADQRRNEERREAKTQ